MADTQDGGEQNSHVGTLVADPESIEATPDSSRKYGGPTARRYLCNVLLTTLVIALVVAALVMSAISLQQSNEALALAETNSQAIENGVVVDKGSTTSDVEHVQDTHEEPPNLTVPSPTPPPNTAKPTEPHPLNPKWYQTTHRDYTMFAEMEYTGDELDHGWHFANMLCSKQLRALCSYETYCRNGQGFKPYAGGPPKTANYDELELTQWAPYLGDPTENAKGHQWVQIGTLSAGDGGDKENGYVQCWRFDDWYSGEIDDIVDLWPEENRVWVLCCEHPDDEEVLDGDLDNDD